MKKQIKWWVGLTMIAVLLSGCGGGGAEVRSEVTTVSTGQQLIDLKRAYEAGAMTHDEYDRERDRVLQRD